MSALPTALGVKSFAGTHLEAVEAGGGLIRHNTLFVVADDLTPAPTRMGWCSEWPFAVQMGSITAKAQNEPQANPPGGFPISIQ
jgi:hypothetical protein